MMMMLMLMTDVVSCYVQLHGFGQSGVDQQPDWYRAVAVSGIQVTNVPHPSSQGIFTYVVDPTSCSTSDNQHFNTHMDDTASQNLINYLVSLANG